MVIKTIKEIAKTIKTGKTPPSKETKYFNGSLNWYTPSDLDKGKELYDSRRKLTHLAIEDKKAITHKAGTLLIGCIGDIGKLGLTTELSSSNQQLTGIYPNSDTDVNYLYYWFKGNKKQLQSYSNNAVVPILNNRTLETVKIPLPPLDQQKQIASILDKADAYRQKTKALIEKYDVLTQSLFLDMFGDPVTNPKGWDFIKVNNIATIVRGSSPRPKGDPRYYGEGVPRLMVADLTRDGVFVTPKIDSLTFEGATKSRPMKKGDLVMAVSGKPGLPAILNVDCCIHDGFAGFRDLSKDYNKVFLYYYFLFYIQEINSRSVGAIFKNITTDDIRKIKIPVLNKNIQNQFAERVKVIDAQKALAQQELVKADNLFNSLLQKAFKGELV